jgi:hypothetical protein
VLFASWTTAAEIRRHVSAPSSQACNCLRVIPEIDIWRAANLMMKRHGAKAFEESSTRVARGSTCGDLGAVEAEPLNRPAGNRDKICYQE